MLEENDGERWGKKFSGHFQNFSIERHSGILGWPWNCDVVCVCVCYCIMRGWRERKNKKMAER
jgi:hypothetical protein